MFKGNRIGLIKGALATFSSLGDRPDRKTIIYHENVPNEMCLKAKSRHDGDGIILISPKNPILGRRRATF